MGRVKEWALPDETEERREEQRRRMHEAEMIDRWNRRRKVCANIKEVKDGDSS